MLLNYLKQRQNTNSLKRSFLRAFYVCTFSLLLRPAGAQTDSTATNRDKQDSTEAGYNLPIFSTSGADAESDQDQQDVSSLLQSSRDVFTQFSSFQFGSARYRLRGYAPENQIVMINGVNVNNLETGFSTWSNWGGLNDVTRYIENKVGVVNSRLLFSGAGGYTNIESKASSFKKGVRVSLGLGNRIFRERVMFTASTGMMKNGWAFTLSGSTRQGNEVYVPGTYFNANAFYFSADKRLNDKHLLSFTGFVAPVEQGRSSAEQEEAYQLTGDHYYNSFWGLQNGKVRNSSVSTVKKPMFMLSHIYNIKPESRLTTSLFYNFGKSGLTSLNWNNSPNPRPDYYRYLPSYFYASGDVTGGNLAAYNWQNDVNTSQINWDRLIAMNRANLYTIPSQVGQGNINTSETRARYIVENRIENMSNMGINMVYNTRVKNAFYTLGLNANYFRNHKYKILDDLLGSTFWLDVDQFAENLGVDESFAQNDISNPNRKVYVGDKFGYDYSTNIRRTEVWGQAEYSFKKVELYGSLSLSNSQMWREGYMANGKFPTTSKGISKKLDFMNYGLKGGFTYKINGRNFITGNGLWLTRPPEVNNVFISPRVRNDIVDGYQNEEVLSGEISYQIKMPDFKFRFTYYNTQISHQTWLRTFWSDEFNNNVNYIMTNVNQNHSGIETGVEKTFMASHTLMGALGMGQFVYNNNPTAQAWQDNNNTSLFTNRTVYLNGYRLGTGPQVVTGIGYRYNGKKFWSVSIYYNYLDQIYLEPNPDRRTAEALNKYVDTDPQYKDITGQHQLRPYSLVNASAYKSFRLMKKYTLAFNLTVNNLLNNKNIQVAGFEQLRWDYSNVYRFANKYYYMTGLTFMLNASLTF